MEIMRLIFCGTPDFAVPSLERLLNSPYRPLLVVTQPDRPRGRGQKLSASPVKQTAEQAGIPLYQPERFNTEETWNLLWDLQPDLAIVVAYSDKIGKTALTIPREGWLNLHPSLLPAYRGAAPLQWAIMEGEPLSGVTTFFLNEAWDAGLICLQQAAAIRSEECYGEAAPRFAQIGADLVLQSVEAIAQGTAPHIPQDDSKASFAPLIRPEDTFLDWSWPAVKIHNRVRGLSPEPGVSAHWREKRVRIMKTRLVVPPGEEEPQAPGEILHADRHGLIVAAGEGALELLMVRPENKGSITGIDFINGARIKVGDCFENGR
jgi:methionyl-tRNA formyltransferase